MSINCVNADIVENYVTGKKQLVESIANIRLLVYDYEGSRKGVMICQLLAIITLSGSDVRSDTVKLYREDVVLYLIIGLTILFVILLGIAIFQNWRQNSLWVRKGNIRSKSYRADRFFLPIYRFLRNFPLTRNYIEKLSYRYRLISPCDSRIIAEKTVTACMISWVFSLLAFVLIFMSSQRLITLIIVGFTIVIVNLEVVGRIGKSYEITMLNEIQKLLANVMHVFFVEYRVDDAIYRTIDTLSPNMKVAADQIYQLLLTDDKEASLREYYENVPNKFLRAFVSQCVGAMERGDQIYDGNALFIRNLENLQREIDIEIDKLQRLSMEFLGVIFCVIAPVFCIDIVKRFAISMKENMDGFYYGKEGFLWDVSLLIVIACIYGIMRKSAEYAVFHQSKHWWCFQIERIPIIKKALDNYCDKNATKMERLKRDLRNNGNNIRPRHFMLRSFLLFLSVFAISITLTFYLQALSRSLLLRVEVEEMEVLTSAAKENQYEGMGKVVEGFTYSITSGQVRMPESKEELIEELRKEGAFYNPVINEALASDILRRAEEYQSERFSFIELMLCLFLSFIGFFIPKWMLLFNSSVSRDAMEDEVNQFNTLIYMLMRIETMTVKQILEELESFAVVFRQSLRSCINDYGSSDIKALNELKEREAHEPFRRIVDNLIRCDEMPIHQAFHEIDIERDGYMAKRKLANEKSIRKRVRRAYILAAVPFILLFAYGLVPTLFTSMKEINALIAELESTSW